MIEFDIGLRDRMVANLARHDVDTIASDDRPRAAVAIIVVGSDVVGDDQPYPPDELGMSAEMGPVGYASGRSYVEQDGFDIKPYSDSTQRAIDIEVAHQASVSR